MELFKFDRDVDVESSQLKEVSKNFSFITAFLAGVMMLISFRGGGMMLSITVIGLISYTAASFAESGDTGWNRELNVISGTTLMAGLLFLSILAFLL